MPAAPPEGYEYGPDGKLRRIGSVPKVDQPGTAPPGVIGPPTAGGDITEGGGKTATDRSLWTDQGFGYPLIGPPPVAPPFGTSSVMGAAAPGYEGGGGPSPASSPGWGTGGTDAAGRPIPGPGYTGGGGIWGDALTPGYGGGTIGGPAINPGFIGPPGYGGGITEGGGKTPIDRSRWLDQGWGWLNRGGLGGAINPELFGPRGSRTRGGGAFGGYGGGGYGGYLGGGNIDPMQQLILRLLLGF